MIPRSITPYETNLWDRGHVAQDILPYMCIYEQCPIPDEMYLNSEELISHVRQHHGTTRWVCNHYQPKTSEDQLFIFETPNEWQARVQQAHGNSVPAKQLASLARVSERQVIQAVTCPLCAYSPIGIQTIVNEHILQHLHEFSLRSLPLNAGGNTQGSISDSTDDGSSAKSSLDGLEAHK
jgi:hypothetical protein